MTSYKALLNEGQTVKETKDADRLGKKQTGYQEQIDRRGKR